jgi:hypothetical protein
MGIHSPKHVISVAKEQFRATTYIDRECRKSAQRGHYRPSPFDNAPVVKKAKTILELPEDVFLQADQSHKKLMKSWNHDQDLKVRFVRRGRELGWSLAKTMKVMDLTRGEVLAIMPSGWPI